MPSRLNPGRITTLVLIAWGIAGSSSGQIPIFGHLRLAAVPAAVTITLTSMPTALEDIVYPTQTVTVIGGTGPYTCAVTSGSLPAGITETSECVYGGTPTTPGTSAFTITATDSLAATDTQDYSITITAAATYPDPWGCSPLDSPVVAGSASENGAGTWTITGSGILKGTSDQGHLCYQAATGNKYISARFTNCTTTGTVAKRCGLLFRTSLDADAPNLACGTGDISGTNYNLTSWRLTTGAVTSGDAIAGSQQYFRITVLGNNIGCDYSADGTTWNALGAQIITVSGTYYLALVANQNNPYTSTATITTVSVGAWTGTPPPVDFGGYRPLWQGFGATAVGGRGGIVCAVNSLDNAATGAAVGGAGNPDYRGTLRYCLVTRTEARFVVFETSGYITLSSAITIVSPYVTMAFQTAPNPGITVRGYPININTHDVIVQHLRMRLGAGNPVCDSAIRIGLPPNGIAAVNVAIDHLSTTWSNRAALAHILNAQDVAVFDSIIGQTFASTAFCTGPEGAANIWYGSTNGTATIMRNLFTSATNRNPWIGAGFRAIHVNNVAYNPAIPSGGETAGVWGFYQVFGTDPSYPAAITELVSDSNVAIAGPATSGANATLWKISLGADQLPSQVYLHDNSLNGSINADQWAVPEVTFCTSCGSGHGGNSANIGNTKITSLPSWYTAFNITPLANTGTAIRDYVLAHAGARPQNRDSVDTQLALDVTAGTGSNALSLTSETAVGGYPMLAVNSQTYTVPANPNNPGTCGTTSAGAVRTIIECDLETKAQAIE